MMTERRERILDALQYVLTLIIERRLGDVPAMLRPFLSKIDLSPETLVGSVEDILTEDDWQQLEDDIFGE